jgi:hypothetical protein
MKGHPYDPHRNEKTMSHIPTMISDYTIPCTGKASQANAHPFVAFETGIIRTRLLHLIMPALVHLAVEKSGPTRYAEKLQIQIVCYLTAWVKSVDLSRRALHLGRRYI